MRSVEIISTFASPEQGKKLLRLNPDLLYSYRYGANQESVNIMLVKTPNDVPALTLQDLRDEARRWAELDAEELQEALWTMNAPEFAQLLIDRIQEISQHSVYCLPEQGVELLKYIDWDYQHVWVFDRNDRRSGIAPASQQKDEKPALTLQEIRDMVIEAQLPCVGTEKMISACYTMRATDFAAWAIKEFKKAE